MTEDEISKIFNSMDIGQNGKVFWNEYLAANISQRIFLKEENLRDAFNHFANTKSTFNIQDIISGLEKPHYQYLSCELMNADELFKECFPNGEQEIDFENFRHFMEMLAK
mmetsp:Transcript_34944/g.33986  ORF Transcript_34944/g.33986 Transcript_34944/m.33986 type:complete len:110 (-) Transcript_34944:42-371(-)|eukprot:CAMPEP_0170564924 /NCGR_PEP_ID=MMETSP0211-20121228/75680_1 /TAXON_ID=311385 /ORGANISM="Pseudokeronopsis sp., Strain OXSARD2" /LENGTH=109 /DNA_ID=CAMNT_0010885031 /DNA_START=960 /DNA_END=1286 /DNA_ORIENTATION=+